MFVMRQQKAVGLLTDKPQVVLDAIPTAGAIYHKGNEKLYVVAPHREEEVVAFRALGLKCPSPIRTYYTWPCQPHITLGEHQYDTAEFLTLNQRALVANEMGTGKTLSALSAAEWLVISGQVKKVLIIAPLSTLDDTWGTEIFRNIFGRKYVILHGTAAKRRRELAKDAVYYIINHDGFTGMAEELLGKFDLIINDEASVYRNRTVRYKKFERFMERSSPDIRLWLMTGTPTPNEPLDAWALARLLQNPYVPKSPNTFRFQTMNKVSQFKWVPKKDAMQTVQKVLQPSIRYERGKVFDMPPTIMQTRHVPFSVEQKDVFDKLVKEFIAEMDAGTITAANEGVKRGKLLQVCGGVVYGDAGEHILLDCKPRVKEVINIINEMDGKVILFAPFKATLGMLERALEKERITSMTINGDVPSNKRKAMFDKWRSEKDPHVILAHPGVMSHGLNLKEATCIIWYGPTDSYDTYTQANARIERPGKGVTSVVVHLQSTSLEKQIYQRLDGNHKMVGVLLDFITQQRRK